MLVGEYEDGGGPRSRLDTRRLTTLVEFLQLQFGLLEPLGFARVNDEDDTVGGASVASPQGAKLVLTSHVPNHVVLVVQPNLKKVIDAAMNIFKQTCRLFVNVNGRWSVLK